MVLFGQTCSIRVKVFVFGQSYCFLAKVVISFKVVVFWHIAFTRA